MTRKELVQALEAKWGVKATYLGVPSCAYEFKCAKGSFIVERDGAIRDMDGLVVTVEELLDASDETVLAETTEEIEDAYRVELPLTSHTVASIRNLINMLAGKQQLFVSSLNLAMPLLDKSLAEDLDQIALADFEWLHAIWDKLKGNRCQGLDLDFVRQTLTVKLLADNPTPDEVAAFHDLVVCIDEMARKLKHSSFKSAQEDNPKFAFRTWLLRLGMNGEKFKTTRKVLLARLSGNSAFRSPKAEEGV